MRELYNQLSMQLKFLRGLYSTEYNFGNLLYSEEGQAKKAQRNICVCYINYKVAHNCVRHERLIDALTEIGLRGRGIIIHNTKHILGPQGLCFSRNEESNNNFIKIFVNKKKQRFCRHKK